MIEVLHAARSRQLARLAIRETLRGIARTHGEPARRSAALTTAEINRLVEVCGDDPAGLRDRALLLVGFAGAFRRSELVGLDVAHVRPTPAGLRLLIPRAKTDAAGEGAEIGIVRGTQADTCPVRALHAWLRAAEIGDGPVFRRVTQWGVVGKKRLHPDAVRQILAHRAAAAGIVTSMTAPVASGWSELPGGSRTHWKAPPWTAHTLCGHSLCAPTSAARGP